MVTALGGDATRARGTLRLTLDRATTQEDMDTVVKILTRIVPSLVQETSV